MSNPVVGTDGNATLHSSRDASVQRASTMAFVAGHVDGDSRISGMYRGGAVCMCVLIDLNSSAISGDAGERPGIEADINAITSSGESSWCSGSIRGGSWSE